MQVDRCVCHRQSFASIQRACRAGGWTTLDEIRNGTRAGTGCGSCQPYLDAMLTTGAVVFAVRFDPTQPIRPL
jgi:NAD(P)H-nitrite reductase large subunit